MALMVLSSTLAVYSISAFSRSVGQAENSISSFPKGGAQNPFDIYSHA